MTRTEHLLWILAEECAEVAQRASKAARFGVNEIQPGQTETNAERLSHEMNDLIGVAQLLADEGALAVSADQDEVAAKRAKVEKFLRYSRECGTLDADEPLKIDKGEGAP
jgi:NTP pyrophosphatase (non-canonical NTP hydrolase)